MKRALLSLGLGTLMLAGFAQDGMKPVGGTGPMITVDKDAHDYGTIKQGGNGECTFTVTNTGDQPLIITNCQGSCGCTVPKCDTNRVGPISKSVTINSNATNAPVKTVNIKGTVEAVAAAAPAVAPTNGKQEAGAPKSLATPQ
jgi:hypothetical protein